MNPYVQTVPTCLLGEAPHWNAAKQELLYIDMVGMSVHRYHPGTGEHNQVPLSVEGAIRMSLVVPVEGQENKYIVGIGRHLQLLDWNGRSSEPGSLSNLQTVEPDYPDNRFNDGKCDGLGRLWAGTGNPDAQPLGNLYRFTGSSGGNRLDRMETGITNSNGITWNKDYSKMFYIDTPTRKVDVFDFDNQQGTISNRRTLFDFERESELGNPDGMNIDADGKLWVACWNGYQVLQLDPTTGKKVSSIQMPTKDITSIAFGGLNLDVMYVTSSVFRLSEEEKYKQASGGALFQITNWGGRGMGPGNNFRMGSGKKRDISQCS